MNNIFPVLEGWVKIVRARGEGLGLRGGTFPATDEGDGGSGRLPGGTAGRPGKDCYSMIHRN